MFTPNTFALDTTSIGLPLTTMGVNERLGRASNCVVTAVLYI